MAILQIFTVPNNILRTISEPVKNVDKNIQILLDDMLETMYASNGVGLAAIQVGIKKRVLVLDLQNDDDINRPKNFYPLFIINPIIIEKSKEIVEATEGCLSVPGEGIKVSRYSGIKVKYLDYYGVEQTLEAEGWFARAIQHEMDHLDGKLLIDYLSKLKRDLAVNRVTKRKRNL